jgi:hypothetical protein
VQDEDDDEPLDYASVRGTLASRSVRPAVGSVDDATARLVLQRYSRDIAAIAGQYSSRLRIGGFADVSSGDLLQVARIAAIEAHALYRPREGESPWSTGHRYWTARVIKWRLRETMQHLAKMRLHEAKSALDSEPASDEDIGQSALQWLFSQLNSGRWPTLARRIDGMALRTIARQDGVTVSRTRQTLMQEAREMADEMPHTFDSDAFWHGYWSRAANSSITRRFC